MLEQTKCTECGESFTGRRDKKFCTDHCRNYFNNRSKQRTDYMKEVDLILRSNRNILRTLLREHEGVFHRRVFRDDLEGHGYDFEFFTNVINAGGGEYVTFCYEYGMVQKGRDTFLVTRRALKSNVSSN